MCVCNVHKSRRERERERKRTRRREKNARDTISFFFTFVFLLIDLFFSRVHGALFEETLKAFLWRCQFFFSSSLVSFF